MTKFIRGFALPVASGIFIFAIAVVVGGYLFVNRDGTRTGSLSQVTQKTSTLTPTPAERRYEDEEFSIIVPSGWSTQTQLPGTLMTAMNLTESHPNDPAAAKINFKSYISVSFDETDGKTLGALTKMVESQISQTVTSAKVIDQKDETIDGEPAKFIEIALTQQGTDFTVFIAIVIQGNKYYVISGNTPTTKWEENRPLFEHAAESFRLKA